MLRASVIPLFVMATLTGSADVDPPAAPAPAPVIAAAPADPGQAAFDAWRAAFVETAVKAGLERGFVVQQMASAVYDPKVVGADRKQPEFSRPIGAYVQAAANSVRIADGRMRLSADPKIQVLADRYGVPAEILAAIWGMESNYGKQQGDTDVVSALATLAVDGRRRSFAETELIAALRLIADGLVERSHLKGSWAGAVGQTQFMPSNILRLGQDGDGDGKIDLWASDLDALASTANLLTHDGWRPGEAAAVEVVLPPHFDWSLLETAQLTPGEWESHGVLRADGAGFRVSEATEVGRVITPAGPKGPAFLLLPNHFVIRRYNNSVAYALAIGLIADGVAGAPPLKTPWPVEVALSLQQRLDAQAALNKLGFSTGGAPDGVIGAGTRAALRAWQAKAGLPADGYLTPELCARLKSEAAT